MKIRHTSSRSILTLALLGAIASPQIAQAQSHDWPVYDGDSSGDHYSSLSQISRRNVSQLHVAWSFDTGESGGLEANPLVVSGVVYACTPTRKVVALDAATGKLLWRFDSGIPSNGQMRGVSYWADAHNARIFAGIGSFLYAIDAHTGKLVSSFGEDGRIDLRKNLGRDYRRQSFLITSPGAIYKDLIIVGGKEPEEPPSPPGDIRAYDVRTGALRWTFHTIPHPGEFGYETWPADSWANAGAANNWAGMVVDTQRGIVYVPTGSAVPDLYGGDRAGDNLFSDTLLALDAATGKRLWHFQAVHHDLWDRDFPAPPVLFTVNRKGKRVDAVAQTTKAGYIFLFDRVTGKPLFPIKETPVPASATPGELAAKTQPIPTLPLPFTRQGITEDILTTRTPEAHAAALQQFRTFASGAGGQFDPPTLNKKTVLLPGPNGGGEWGGAAVDRKTGVLYVNANETPRTFGLAIPPAATSIGQHVYVQRCSSCHGVNRAGIPPEIPSLIGIDNRLTDAQITEAIHQGKGRMPQFNDIAKNDLSALLRYLKGQNTPATKIDTASEESKAPAYKSSGGGWFNDPDGYPAITPPWGTLNAIDMNTGKYLWKIPLGSYPELTAQGLANTGALNYGGPIVTAGGLVFIGATVFNSTLHAYDSHTGKLLWEGDLPFSGLATPSTYMANGKQYILIAAGGGMHSKGKTGGVYIAFALP